MSNSNLSDGLVALGSGATRYAHDKPDATLLEAFPCPKSEIGQPEVQGAGGVLSLNITCPEFTSLCPKTGQPDFATIVIDYIPRDLCVESKALKLYLGSFRNHGEFHEACVMRISDDLVRLLKPRWLRVIGKFTPRGGIPFWPTVTYPPRSLSIPNDYGPRGE